jgi:hypothetical protein
MSLSAALVRVYDVGLVQGGSRNPPAQSLRTKPSSPVPNSPTLEGNLKGALLSIDARVCIPAFVCPPSRCLSVPPLSFPLPYHHRPLSHPPPLSTTPRPHPSPPHTSSSYLTHPSRPGAAYWSVVLCACVSVCSLRGFALQHAEGHRQSHGQECLAPQEAAGVCLHLNPKPKP